MRCEVVKRLFRHCPGQPPVRKPRPGHSLSLRDDVAVPAPAQEELSADREQTDERQHPRRPQAPGSRGDDRRMMPRVDTGFDDLFAQVEAMFRAFGGAQLQRPLPDRPPIERPRPPMKVEEV